MAQQMPMINVGGNLPPEILQQQQALNRQQQMAQLLMQQGQQMPSGQMVSGRFVAPSFFQYAAPLFQTYTGTKLAEKGDKASADLAKALRQQYASEAQQYQDLLRGKQATYGPDIPTETYENVKGQIISPAVPANPQGAYLFGSTAYNPALQQIAFKKLTEGPKWEKAELPNPDGSVRKGWVDYNAANPLSTFIEGGTKPAFTSLEAARFQYDTGMKLPTGNVPANAPMNMPVGASPNQVSNSNMPVNQAGQIPMVGGRGMSPSAMNEANKQVFVDVEKRRIENLEKSPQVIATITDTLRNVDDLIGDARIIKDAKGKEKIDYTITQDGKSVQGRKPLAGFETAVGFGLPSYLTPAGSSASDFRVRLDQIKDRTFLQAFESLKGSGQITEKEGEKATSALNRMSTAQSEIEFIKAAREFEENLRTGMDLAKKKAGLPTSGSAKLRWNPKTNSWE
jgi:hypothetical protein